MPPWLKAALLACLLAAPATAQPVPDAQACRRAITAAEPRSGLPAGLLLAIAQIESGRADPRTGRVEPWPWSYNVEGEGHAPATRDAALAEVSALQAAGRRSIDIGCMQINLMYHPQAFASLEQGFDPAVNLAYAIRFLKELFARHGSWPAAIAHYHSGEEARGDAYRRKVQLARLSAAWRARPSSAPRDLCAPGLRPDLVQRGNRTRVVCRR